MSEQIEKNEVSLRKKSSGPKLRTISSLKTIFSRPKSLNMHPDLQMKKSQSYDDDGAVSNMVQLYESKTPDTTRRHRKISSLRRPTPESLVIPQGPFRSSTDGISDLQLNKAILRSQISTDHGSETDDEFGPEKGLKYESGASTPDGSDLPMFAISMPPIPFGGGSTVTLKPIDEEECDITDPYSVCSQIFTDDINRAIDLVLQDNGRSLEEKRKDINAIKFQLAALRSSVSMNMQLLLLSDLWSLDDPVEKVEKPKASPMLLRGISKLQK